MKTFLAKCKSSVQVFVLNLSWWLAAKTTMVFKKGRQSPARGAFLVPSDPFKLTGSRGDVAMLEGARRALGGEVLVLVASESAQSAAKAVGVGAVRVKFDWFLPFRFVFAVVSLNPRQVFVMGADVMDGHYSAVHSQRLLICADVAARLGVDSRFLGFSMNSMIDPNVSMAFGRLSANVRLNVRDPVSLERLQRLYTPADVQLVADTAFLLSPAELLASSHSGGHRLAHDVLAWIEGKRAEGLLVVGLNLHGMLFDPDSRQLSLARLLASVSKMMVSVAQRRRVAWVLLPHDDRAGVGDVDALAALHRQIGDVLRSSVVLVPEVLPTADLKALSGSLDGVVSGRMHLAIATLGMGRPVLVLSYQGKFEGLLQLFSLSRANELDPVLALDPLYLTRHVDAFLDGLEEQTRIVRSKLDFVMKLALLTFR